MPQQLTLEARAILPQNMDPTAIMREIIGVMPIQGAKMVPYFQRTTASWDEQKVDFDSRTGLDGGDPYAWAGPTGGSEVRSGVNAMDVWRWLNEGTTHRWAVMSVDWASKTKVGTLASGGGQGYVRFKGRGAMQAAGYKHAMDGIDARGWTTEIVRLRYVPFKKAVEGAVFRGAGHLWKGAVTVQKTRI